MTVTQTQPPRPRLSSRATGALAIVVIALCAAAILYSILVDGYPVLGPLGLALAAAGSGALLMSWAVERRWRSVRRAEGFGAAATLAGAAFGAPLLAFPDQRGGPWGVLGISVAIVGALAQLIVFFGPWPKAPARVAAAGATLVGAVTAALALAGDGVTPLQTLLLVAALAVVAAAGLAFFDWLHP